MFLITWDLLHDSSIFGAEHLHPEDYSLLPPCLHFAHAITHVDVKLGSGSRLTLTGWPCNQLDCADFIWHTKNSLFDRVSIGKFLLCVNQKMITRYGLAELGQAVDQECKDSKNSFLTG